MSTVNENSFCQQLAEHSFRHFAGVKFDRQHQAHTAHVFHRRMLRLELLQLRSEVFPQLGNVRNQVIELAQKFNRDSTGQRSAPESRAMQPRMHSASNALGGKQRAQWQSSRQRFRNSYDVGLGPVMLIRKVFSGASKATLNFIKQEKRA